MNLFGKKVGIWGFGIVGKSVLNLINSSDVAIEILEKKEVADKDKAFFLKQKNVRFIKENSNIDIKEFLDSNELIIPSPGVDLSPYQEYSHKWLSELDIFYLNFKKPIIAITGSLGKTTVTHFLTNFLKLEKKVIAAGNIGYGMCDIVSSQDSLDLVVLETSSFQLEICKYFCPNLSILTNFYPNHLDRHKTLNSYLNAKMKIFEYQNDSCKALLPLDLYKNIYEAKVESSINFFRFSNPGREELSNIRSIDSIFCVIDNYLVKIKNGVIEPIICCDKFPDVTFLENWVIIFSALYLQSMDFKKIDFSLINLDLPEHRVEKFANYKNIDFYDDSKSTISNATLAAISKFKNRSIILFLGGLSKGVDRSFLIASLQNKVRMVICFGAEAEVLHSMCKLNGIKSFNFTDLENAVNFCIEVMQSGDVILFSPAGSSYDLFKDYQDRGKHFKNLISIYLTKLSRI